MPGEVPNLLLQGPHYVAPILWASSSPVREEVVFSLPRAAQALPIHAAGVARV